MFEGVQDQFHQFLVTETPQSQIRASSNSLPISFSLFHNPNPNPFPIFETYNPNSHPHLQPQVHHQILPNPPLELQYPVKREGEKTSLDLDNPWSHDEVLALFRVRSAMENWFPEFTWEHVSRKLEEIGFIRSPQKCKEKFEEESRSYMHTNNTINADEVNCPNKNYRLFSELEELYRNDVVLDKQNPEEEEEELQEQEQEQEQEDDHDKGQERLLDENDGSEATDNHQQIVVDEIDEVEKETKREKKFELFKSFCEDIVKKMMDHQEELHQKILEDLVRRDDEKIAREEAWKKQEMERINKEMEARAKDQAMAEDRQAKIIEFLKKFTSNSNNVINTNEEFNAPINQNPSSSTTHSTSQNCHIHTSSNDESLSQTSNSLTTHIDPMVLTSNSAEENDKIQAKLRKPRINKRPYNDSDKHDDIGKRWPREEVIALINIRSNLDSTYNTGPDINRKESNKNPPLWERISKSMMELGYKRSAKRCKEKWENINKYFRKTKDSKKKRSVDSRTCPYFHQLSHMYNNGRVSGTSHGGLGGSGSSNVGVDGAALNVSDQSELNGVHATTSPCDS